MSPKSFAFIVLVLIFALIIELIRREKLTFRYAFGWIFAVFVALGIIFAERAMQSMAKFFGFTLLSNFIFFCYMGIAVILGLLLTVLLCRQDKRNERMAKKIAWLEHELEQFKSGDR